jgi:hypothetical protein
MNKETARELLLLINDPQTWDALQKYANSRIEGLRGHLESEKEHQKIIATQGAIAELRRLFTLREEVRERSK